MARALVFLRAGGPFVVTGHVRPDGDALGSALALGRLLQRQGIPAVVSAEPAELGSPAFLEGCEAIVPPAVAAAGPCGALVTVDCGAVERLPEPLQPLVKRVPSLNIDHHRTNSRFAAVNWIEERASSTGELIWRLSRRAGWPLDRATAEALWVAVVTDTGRFAYDQTRPATLMCAADLVRHSVRTSLINDRIYGAFSRRVLELKRRAFNSLAVWRDGEVATVALTRRDFEETGCTKADAEDVIEIPRSLAGSSVALFFYEAGGSDDVTRVSIRTRAPLDATLLAGRYGGGGHARAAGCNVPAPLPAAMALVQQAVDAWLDQPKGTAD
jgi:phosphoesterase RecJ-like protein